MNLTTIDNVDKVKVFKDRLKNGLTVVSIEQPHIHSMELGMFVRSGLRFENEKNNGISHFLEHMLFRGNAAYPNSYLLNREFEGIGRDLRASTMSDHTYYGFSPHVSNLERAMELFSEFFHAPTFPEIEIERGIILEECLEDFNEQGIDVDINNLACKLLYPDNALAWPTIGTEESIKNISVEILKEQYEKYYVPGNMILVQAGCVDHDVFVDYANKYFPRLTGEGSISTNCFDGCLDESQTQPEFLFQQDSDSQVQLQICFRGVSYNHPDYFITNLISRLFDDGVTSRLQKVLREEKGLVYSVECRATSLPDTGTVDFDVSVRSEKVIEVTEILLNEIKKLVLDGVHEEELEGIKRRYGYDLDYELDDPYKQIVRYGFCHLYSSEFTAEEERELISRISSQDIQRVARNIFVPEKLNFILVGPYTPALKSTLEGIVLNF
ncbi:MAG: pitrilysin family protein [Nitrospinaceae bacterium]|nr:pitrilysin family protein [Nitrospinaceae bacterium]MDP6711492.1 pitrilysin family protein [Nitrospinaceae bacterium]